MLTETLCSLKGNVERFAFSTVWEMTPDAKIVKEDFFRRIIHSKVRVCREVYHWSVLRPLAHHRLTASLRTLCCQAAMTYAQAQALLDDPAAKSPVAQGVKDLAKIARILRCVHNRGCAARAQRAPYSSAPCRIPCAHLCCAASRVRAAVVVSKPAP